MTFFLPVVGVGETTKASLIGAIPPRIPYTPDMLKPHLYQKFDIHIKQVILRISEARGRN